MAPINGPVMTWTPPSSPKSRPHQTTPLSIGPAPEDVVSDMTANSPQSCPIGHVKGGIYVNLFSPFVQLYVYLYSVPAHLVFNPRIGFSVLCSWLMIGFFFHSAPLF